MSDNWHRPRPYPAPEWLKAIDEAPPPPGYYHHTLQGEWIGEPKRASKLSELWGVIVLVVMLAVMAVVTRAMALWHWLQRLV